VFPTFVRRNKSLGIPDWTFFIAKYFGSGVIIATAFIHLLAPANENLGNECLTGVITKYPWPEAIALMTIFLMFFLELMTMRFGTFGGEHSHEGHTHGPPPPASSQDRSSLGDGTKDMVNEDPHVQHHARGEDHLGHARDHQDNASVDSDWAERGGNVPETYAAQMTAIFILEFGVIFHSIFIGLTLAVAGSEFVTLYVVLVFHQVCIKSQYSM
jgi:zinc transporter 1/2/3